MSNLGACDNTGCPYYTRFKMAEKCAVLYEDGASLRQIAKLVGRDHEAVSDYLKWAGVKMRPPGQCAGPQNPCWRGGRNISRGYVRLRRRGHVMANKDGYVSEHRMVMAAYLDRPLLPAEVVHHVDGNGLNNKIENLSLFPSQATHLAYHRSSETTGKAKGEK